ncbi:MAG: PQ-loop domain-containing transporter [Candidatus Gastranaerophilales bacterium]|nr:PQ-loop domain-containing transporter [Candidatus Gastranaerophilales bacterium]
MSIFEIGMLVCFGASWPFAVVKTYKTKNVKGKSILFLILVLIGYLFGILHKIFHNYDMVIYLYMLNGLMVLADIILYFRYRKR